MRLMQILIGLALCCRVAWAQPPALPPFFGVRALPACSPWCEQAGLPIGNWNASAMSADGSIIAVADNSPGDLWLSTNGGTVWSDISGAGSRGWFTLAMSSSGSVILGAYQAGSVTFTGDGGGTWTTKAIAGSTQLEYVAVSGDGMTMAVADDIGKLFLSTDGGMTWNANSAAGSHNYFAVSISRDGSTLGAIYITQPGNVGTLITSINGGTSWNSVGPNTNGFDNLVVSSDGSHLAVYDQTSVWTSANAGVTWNNRAGDTGGVFCGSDDGIILMGLDNFGNLTRSADGGANWIIQSSPPSDLFWSLNMSCSASGLFVALPILGGRIWRGSF